MNHLSKTEMRGRFVDYLPASPEDVNDQGFKVDVRVQEPPAEKSSFHKDSAVALCIEIASLNQDSIVPVIHLANAKSEIRHAANLLRFKRALALRVKPGKHFNLTSPSSFIQP